MNFQEVAASLTPEVYQRLKEAVELGKWPNGDALSREQKALCLEALMTYEARNGVPENERIGYIERPDGSHANPFAERDDGNGDTQPIRLIGDGDTLQ